MHSTCFLFHDLLTLINMQKINRKEVVVLEPNLRRFQWIQSALAEWPNSPKLLHFKDQHQLLLYLSEERTERQSFFLIDARQAKKNKGLLLQKLRKHTPHRFTPIVLACPDARKEDFCLLADRRINATIMLPKEKELFQKKIRSTFTFWGRFNITT